MYSPYTYDATFLLVDAMKRANSVDPKVYVNELAKANFKGVLLPSPSAQRRNEEPSHHAVRLKGRQEDTSVIGVWLPLWGISMPCSHQRLPLGKPFVCEVQPVA